MQECDQVRQQPVNLTAPTLTGMLQGRAGQPGAGGQIQPTASLCTIFKLRIISISLNTQEEKKSEYFATRGNYMNFKSQGP